MIQLEIFAFNPLQVNACLVYEPGGAGVLIDPSCMDNAEFSRLEEFITGNGIRLEYLVITHGHFDHVFGVRQVMDTFHPKFVANRGDLRFLHMAAEQAGSFGFGFNGPVPEPDGFLEDGDVVAAGSIRLEVRHVPGHSPGCISLYEASMGWLFSGDTLFAGGIGRTDLPGGDYGQIIESIRNRLLILPDETIVIPGHGTTSTIGKERRSNPFLV